jgi:hypothetical protein
MVTKSRSALLLFAFLVVLLGALVPLALVIRRQVFLYQKQPQADLEYFTADLLRAAFVALFGMAIPYVLFRLSRKPEPGTTRCTE